VKADLQLMLLHILPGGIHLRKRRRSVFVSVLENRLINRVDTMLATQRYLHVRGIFQGTYVFRVTRQRKCLLYAAVKLLRNRSLNQTMSMGT
jgi:23S rRNA G2445 N2-methylase RlmL